jgi:hypothetical protein
VRARFLPERHGRAEGNGTIPRGRLSLPGEGIRRFGQRSRDPSLAEP